jgi:hypothetical protein
MKYIKLFEQVSDYKIPDYRVSGYKPGDEIEIKFVGSRNPRIKFSLFKDRSGRITRVEKTHSVRFPYKVGDIFNRSVETWACNNNFLIDGRDVCPEGKVFGIKKSDIPQGHEFRRLFPNKFR